MNVPPDHRLFKSRTDYAVLVAGNEAMRDSPAMLQGYLLGLETAAAACRSHIISASEKFGPQSSGVRIGRADLCCIQREIRRARLRVIVS